MSNYKIVFFSPDNRQLGERQVKIKHFRNFEGRDVSTTGGYTALFDLSNSHIIVSRCRNDESFSRKKGVLTCIQKALNSGSLSFGEFSRIHNYKSHNNELHIFLTKPNEKMFWWL